MDQEALTAWALANGWRIIAGCPSLTRPATPRDAIVRLVFKATVVALEVRKPAGKWEKLGGAPYARVQPDPDTGWPCGLGLEAMPGLTMLMRDNKDLAVFDRLGPASRL